MKLFNSLGKKTETFVPLADKKAGVYTCGPTVYDYAHIGNLRAYIFADILVRALKYEGLETKWVMNITDVDDKTIARSREQFPGDTSHEALKKFTALYEQNFRDDLERLNISRPDFTPRATETIPEMQQLILRLIEEGYAYEKDGSVYFSIKKYSEKYAYGQLADLDLAQIKAGATVSSDQYEKEEVSDFVVWKAAKENEPSWDFEIGGKNYPGRPGWHIECSAMSQKYLGIPFDIHTGGIDLKFPHHENELAQTAAGCDCGQPVKYWAHNEHLLVDNKKMSKSLGNFYTLRDLEEKGFDPLAFRFLCLQTHYRSKMNFTWDSLRTAQNGLNNLRHRLAILARTASDTTAIEPAQIEKIIGDDLDTPELMAFLAEAKDLSAGRQGLNLILETDKILGLNLESWLKEEKSPEIRQAEKEIDEARKKGDYAASDKMRKEWENKGYSVVNASGGTIIIKNDLGGENNKLN